MGKVTVSSHRRSSHWHKVTVSSHWRMVKLPLIGVLCQQTLCDISAKPTSQGHEGESSHTVHVNDGQGSVEHGGAHRVVVVRESAVDEHVHN